MDGILAFVVRCGDGPVGRILRPLILVVIMAFSVTIAVSWVLRGIWEAVTPRFR